jgi:hypothetical protein
MDTDKPKWSYPLKSVCIRVHLWLDWLLESD